jgi:hypothetical protein
MDDPLTQFFSFLYNPVTTRYFIDICMGIITLFINALIGHSNLKGAQYFYKAGSIKGGAGNWILFTFYLTLFVPHYFGNFTKLEYFSVLIGILWLIAIGCAVAATKGSKWKEIKWVSYIALYGSSLVLATISFIILVIFDSALFV